MDIILNYTNSIDSDDIKTYRIFKPGGSIGTDSGCTIVIESNTDKVDFLHAMINFSEENKFYISNLSISKPIYLNGEPLKFARQVMLNSLDIIKIDVHSFQLTFSNEHYKIHTKKTESEISDHIDTDMNKMWRDLDCYLNSTNEVKKNRTNFFASKSFANEFSSKNINPYDPLSEISHDFTLKEIERDKPDILTFFDKEEDFGNGGYLFEEGISTIPKDYNESMDWLPKKDEVIVDPLYHFEALGFKWSENINLDAQNNITDAFPPFHRTYEDLAKENDDLKDKHHHEKPSDISLKTSSTVVEPNINILNKIFNKLLQCMIRK